MTGTSTTPSGLSDGLHVMAIGVVLQLVLTGIFIGFLLEFSIRYGIDRPIIHQKDLLWYPKKILSQCRIPWSRRKSFATLSSGHTSERNAAAEQKPPGELFISNSLALPAAETERAIAKPRYLIIWVELGVLTFATLMIVIR